MWVWEMKDGHSLLVAVHWRRLDWLSQCGRDKLDGSMDAERTVSSCSINVLQIACLAAAFF